MIPRRLVNKLVRGSRILRDQLEHAGMHGLAHPEATARAIYLADQVDDHANQVDFQLSLGFVEDAALEAEGGDHTLKLLRRALAEARMPPHITTQAEVLARGFHELLNEHLVPELGLYEDYDDEDI